MRSIVLYFLPYTIIRLTQNLIISYNIRFNSIPLFPTILQSSVNHMDKLNEYINMLYIMVWLV